MRLFKYVGVRVLAAALALTAVPAAVPTNTPVIGASSAQAQHRHYGPRHGFGGPRGYGRGYYRGGPGRYYGRGYYRPGRYYGGRRYYRRHNDGAAVAAGIIGLGVGAAIAGAAQPRYYEPRPVYGGYAGGLTAHDRYCLARYRSYDPASGTYQPYNGPRRYCR